MRINLDGTYLIVVTTLGCNAACGHCLYNCCPEKAGVKLSGEEISNILKSARAEGIYNVCFNGGEPLIFPEDIFNAVVEADNLGYATISVRTNGFWAVDDRTTEKVLLALQSCGVGEIGISYDFYHSPFVLQDNVKRLMKAAEEVGLAMWIDWVGGETGKCAWEHLGDYMRFMRGRPDPPCRVGRARSLPNDHFYGYDLEQLEFEDPYSFTCGDPANVYLEVYPSGYARLHSCCLPNPRLFKQRSANGNWIRDIAKQVENDPAIDFLHRHGVGGLIRKARRECPELLKPYYSSSCEVCWQLLGALFPVNNGDVGSLFSENGFEANIRKSKLMTDRRTREVDRVAGGYVREVEGGYSLIPRFDNIEMGEKEKCGIGLRDTRFRGV